MNGHNVIMFFHRISLKLRPTLKTESEIVLLAERKVLLTLTFQRRTSKETFVPHFVFQPLCQDKNKHLDESEKRATGVSKKIVRMFHFLSNCVSVVELQLLGLGGPRIVSTIHS